jgi:hypothetical protein
VEKTIKDIGVAIVKSNPREMLRKRSSRLKALGSNKKGISQETEGIHNMMPYPYHECFFYLREYSREAPTVAITYYSCPIL